MFMCVYVHVCMWVCVHVWTHMHVLGASLAPCSQKPLSRLQQGNEVKDLGLLAQPIPAPNWDLLT